MVVYTNTEFHITQCDLFVISLVEGLPFKLCIGHHVDPYDCTISQLVNWKRSVGWISKERMCVNNTASLGRFAKQMFPTWFDRFLIVIIPMMFCMFCLFSQPEGIVSWLNCHDLTLWVQSNVKFCSSLKQNIYSLYMYEIMEYTWKRLYLFIFSWIQNYFFIKSLNFLHDLTLSSVDLRI